MTVTSTRARWERGDGRHQQWADHCDSGGFCLARTRGDECCFAHAGGTGEVIELYTA